MTTKVKVWNGTSNGRIVRLRLVEDEGGRVSLEEVDEGGMRVPGSTSCYIGPNGISRCGGYRGGLAQEDGLIVVH